MAHLSDIEGRYAKMAEYRRRRLARDPAYRAKVCKDSLRRRTPEQHRASAAVSRAIKRGDLVRPDACSCCGEVAYIEAAHVDYSQPLLVVWLCRSCHRRWDRDEPKQRKSREERSKE